MTLPTGHTNTATRPYSSSPRCWVGCLGCYNAGRLVGQWCDAMEAPEDIRDFESVGVFLPCVHFVDGHDELWVFDHEGFGGVLTGECSPVEARRVAELIGQAEERGLPVEAVAYWVHDGHEVHDVTEFLDDLIEAYCGRYDSGADYAQELAEDVGAIPVELLWPMSCIDWGHAWRELELGGDNYAVRSADSGLLVFRAV